MQNKNDKCAPSKKFIDESCFTLESLKLIASKYNEQNKTNKINITNNKKQLVSDLTNVFSKNCSTQSCWLRLDIVKNINNEDILENTFRPEGPLKKYDWLSTTNIDDVLNQYEKLHKDFVFLGAVPNDFEELPILGLSNIDFNDFMNKGKTKLGMVINLDTHDQSGSHWVALYTDLSNNKLYYFDSVGKKPGKRIKKFNNKIINFLYNKDNKDNLQIGKIYGLINILDNKKIKNKYLKLLDKKLEKYDIRYNNIQHQQKNSECGVYSINFILRLAKGESFDDVTQNITTDDEINKCRKVYFNNT